MPTKIRLQRFGKKGRPFYHIVIADGRAPRDGRFIEKIGTYNPVSKPAEIDLDFDKAMYWLQTGAQPTDTVRSILSFKGILYKYHLYRGILKGALTQEQADLKFQQWNDAKLHKLENASKEVENKERSETKKRLEAEAKIKDARAEALAKKRAEELEKEIEKAREKKAELDAAKAAKEAAREAAREAREAAKEEKSAE